MKSDFDKAPFNKAPIWYDSDMVRAVLIGAVIGFVIGLFVGYDLGYEPVVRVFRPVIG